MNQEQRDLVKEIKNMQTDIFAKLGDQYLVNAIERLIIAHIKLERLIEKQSLESQPTEAKP